MIRQELLDYIKQQLSQGINREIIINSLIGAGWQKTDVDDSFATIISSPPQVSSQSFFASSSSPISENNYPVQFRWVYKSWVGFFIAFIISIILLLFDRISFYLIFIIIYSPIHFMIIILRRKNFHYIIDEKFMVLRQGILSKQQRHIPYGVIQNVFVKQDLFDRLFGLASLTIENAAQGAGAKDTGQSKIFGMKVSNKKKQEPETVGFSGNRVSIPGLKTQDAETLKGIVLQKMKENPIEDNQSGL